MSEYKERDSFYLASLLHDIGKFIERSKHPEWLQKAKDYLKSGEASSNYAHRRYSAAFVKEYYSEDNNRFAEQLALWHHKGNDPTKQDFVPINEKGVFQKLLVIADHCASAERRIDNTLDPVLYYKAKILSPFNAVSLGKESTELRKNEKRLYNDLQQLTIKKTALFPLSGTSESADNPYNKKDDTHRTIVDRFEDEVKSRPDALFPLLEKYLVTVPAQTPFVIKDTDYLYLPDINLYDHSRLTAAIALSLYDEYKEGTWKGEDATILSEKYWNLSPPCIAIGGDVSGIQDFIFSIVTDEKVARSLKGRSYFVQLVTEVCVQYLIDELNLKEASVLYNGGGNFYILAPACVQAKIHDCQKEITKALLNSGLYVNIATTEVKLEEFRKFGDVWKRLHTELSYKKKRRFSELTAEEVFEPFSQSVEKNDYDIIATKLYKAYGYRIVKKSNNTADKWQKPIERLGYSVGILHSTQSDATCFNSTDFTNGWKNFKFSVKDFPLEMSVKGVPKVVDFDTIAGEAEQRTGTAKLAALKMDIDNLGRIFTEGLHGDMNTISRVATLSRSIQWFFEGYMNTLLTNNKFLWYNPQDEQTHGANYYSNLYPIFSGGDDFFVVGAWDAVFEFALLVQREFTEYVGENPSVTLSGGIVMIDPKFPVARFAPMASEAIDKAKNFSPQKNSVNILGATLTWKEYSEAQKLKDKIVDMVQKHGESRAIIEKIQRSSIGFEYLQKDTLQRRIKPDRVWRLAHYLRDVGKGKKQTDEQKDICRKTVEEIIHIYEELIFKSLKGEVVNPMTFSIAARWAEFNTRIKIKQ